MKIPKELLKDHHEKRCNEILAKVTKSRLQEAERARKKRMGETPFSQKWAEAALKLQAWNAVLKWRNKGKHKRKIRQVKFLVKEAKLKGVFEMNPKEIKNRVRLAKNIKRQ